MAVFTYKATDATAIERTGTIAADTPRQARDLLRDRGLIVKDLLDYNPARAATTASSRPRLRVSLPRLARSRNRHRATDFLRELSTLLGVGVPLLESLDTLAKQHDADRFAAIIVLLRDRVAGGSSLAHAMREQPDTFDELTISITEVGEDAGTLDTSLERLAEFRERSQQLRGRLSTALIYPTIVLTLAIFASVFLMTFVVPKILEPLIEQGQPLPLPTRIVKSFSDFLLSWGWLVALAAACLFAGTSAILRTPRGKLAFHRILLKLP